jgi:hypothetical protein
MSITPERRLLVRQRASFACEYCGVTEIDSGGELTIDHYQPPRKGGSVDDLANLLYCCYRCNQYKSDYWPTTQKEIALWNPRSDARDTHMLLLTDGTLYATTEVGAFTLRRIRLNREALVINRRKRQDQQEERRILEELQSFVQLQARLQQHHARLLEEQQALLEQQRALMNLLLQLLKQNE